LSRSPGEKLDLVVLVADSQTQRVLEQLLTERRKSLRIRPMNFRVFVHPERDPGCLNKPEAILGGLAGSAQRALLIFDHHGCGREQEPPEKLEEETRKRLHRAGWDPGRVEVILISPELEAWVWSDSQQVAQSLGWEGTTADLKRWMASEGLWQSNTEKPQRPKEALEAVLRTTGEGPPILVLVKLASGVSLARCTDRAFARLKQTLRKWFPAAGGDRRPRPGPSPR